MKRSRRMVLHLVAGAAALPSMLCLAMAQAYPSRPVRIIVGFAAGGGQDMMARLMGQWLSERLGQQFVIENRPGAGGNIAAEAGARAPADGYTLLLVGPQNAINATLFDKLSFNFLRDIAPVASISREASLMVASPSLPARTIPEFIAHAKANPSKVNMASAGIGSAGHVAGELFKMMTGLHLAHVPYRGLAPALTDLIGGQVDVCFANLPGAIEQVRSGKLRALAVTTAMRSEALPDVPALGEFVAGYEASSLFGLGAPKSTSAAIIDLLNKEINAALVDPKIKARLVDFGDMAVAGSPADFGALMAEETEKWGKVVKAAAVKPE
jgi:tripartite-type tricarboxylate transporter receptor subunit TctC